MSDCVCVCVCVRARVFVDACQKTSEYAASYVNVCRIQDLLLAQKRMLTHTLTYAHTYTHTHPQVLQDKLRYAIAQYADV